VMSQGVIRQLGTPEQIYREPANIEIARLFGDPTINLLDVKPARDSRGIYVGLSNVQVHLAGAYDTAVGRDCVIGLRPEALSFVEESTPGAIPVTVEAETPLNEKIVTLVRTVRGREILVSRPAGTPGRSEGKAHIAVDGKSALLFDHASGERIGSKNVVALRNGEAA
jgi:multiple sugar transport system ATP-binding protein